MLLEAITSKSAYVADNCSQGHAGIGVPLNSAPWVPVKFYCYYLKPLGFQEILENCAHLVKDQKPSMFFSFSYLKKALFISAVQ